MSTVLAEPFRIASAPVPACVGLDTACGKGGFLTAFELPANRVYESRD